VTTHHVCQVSMPYHQSYTVVSKSVY